jgi:hypothetical protein
MSHEVAEYCVTCRFWEFGSDRGGRTWGNCRRRSPKIRREPTDHDWAGRAAQWPITNSRDWCGKWEGKPKL